MTEIQKLVKGEKTALPVALIGGSGAGWVTADPAVDGLLVIPKCGVGAVILSESDLADFGYVKRRNQKRVSVPSSTDNKPKPEGARKRKQRDGSSAKSGGLSGQ